MIKLELRDNSNMRADLLILFVCMLACCCRLSDAQNVIKLMNKQLENSKNFENCFAGLAELKQSLSNQDDLNAVNTLLELENLLKISGSGKYPDSCNRRGYEILRKAHELTIEIEAGPNAIDDLVHHYTKKHVFACRDAYREQFLQKVEFKLMPNLFGIVGEFFKSSQFGNIPKRPYDFNVKGIYDILFKIDKFDTKKTAHSMYNAMVNLCSLDDSPYLRYLYALVNSPSGTITVFENKIEAMLNKYFVNPCSDYIKTFGPDIFTPADYELMSISPNHRYNFDSTREDFDYFLGWRNFRLCKILMRSKHELLKEIVDIVKRSIA